MMNLYCNQNSIVPDCRNDTEFIQAESLASLAFQRSGRQIFSPTGINRDYLNRWNTFGLVLKMSGNIERLKSLSIQTYTEYSSQGSSKNSLSATIINANNIYTVVAIDECAQRINKELATDAPDMKLINELFDEAIFLITGS